MILTITPPGNLEFYTFPSGLPDPSYIHLSPYTYIASPGVPPEVINSGASWSMTTNPPSFDVLMNGLSAAIDADTGLINASAVDSTAPPGGYDFDITVFANMADCQIERQNTFTVTLLQNEWCGDTFINGWEDCDDGRDGDPSDDCTDACRDTYCGDGNIVQIVRMALEISDQPMMMRIVTK
jgi:hypothetical protein